MKDYPCYRDYVISSLSQLKTLDGVEVTRTERFKAQQNLMENRHDIIQLQVDKDRMYPKQMLINLYFFLVSYRFIFHFLFSRQNIK